MQSAIASGSSLAGLLDDLVLTQLAVLDGLINSNDVLPDDTASADVQVSNLGVAHEALGKPYRQRRGIEFGEAVHVLGELVHDGSFGGGNGIAILRALVGGNTPTINDDYSSARAP